MGRDAPQRPKILVFHRNLYENCAKLGARLTPAGALCHDAMMMKAPATAEGLSRLLRETELLLDGRARAFHARQTDGAVETKRHETLPDSTGAIRIREAIKAAD